MDRLEAEELLVEMIHERLWRMTRGYASQGRRFPINSEGIAAVQAAVDAACDEFLNTYGFRFDVDVEADEWTREISATISPAATEVELDLYFSKRDDEDDGYGSSNAGPGADQEPCKP